ncbi:unnamed protein product, partial [Ostreobium quekettii]
EVEDFLAQRKVPASLSDRVRSFFSYILSRQIIVEETSIINEMSVPLRTEMVMFLYREALQKLPFFQGKDPQFIVHIVTALKLEYYTPGEVVVRQGDPGNVMYFIGKGRLEVRLYFSSSTEESVRHALADPDEKASDAPMLSRVTMKPIVGTASYDFMSAKRRNSFIGPAETYKKLGVLTAGDYFGEYSCLLGEYRTATVVADNFCELYSLSRADLDDILEDLPELGKEFLKMVDKYIQKGVVDVPGLRPKK